MRALIITTGRLVSPFGEAPGAALFGMTTVGEHVRALFAKRGLDVVVVEAGAEVPAGGAAVVIADHCFVSERCLGHFLGKAFAQVTTTGEPARLALAKTPSVEFTLPLSSATTEPFAASGPGAKTTKKPNFLTRRESEARERVAFDCFFVNATSAGVSGVELLQQLRETSARVVVPKAELGIPMRMPTLGDGGAQTLLIPLTSTMCLHIEHWVHILWLNQGSFGGRWFEVLREQRLWIFGKTLLSLPLLLWTRNPAVVPLYFNRVGKNVRIHPTATVEASFLGDNVVVGARASIRNSVVGHDVVIGDHASVISSTIGNRAQVTPRTFVVWSAAYEDAVVSNYKLQVSLIGRGASLSTWAGFVDAKLQGTIEVMHDGKLRSTERSFLGSCLGHGAHVGAKVLLLPGREVPNGAFIAMRDDELIREVPTDLPAGVPLVRDHGTLVPLSSAKPS